MRVVGNPSISSDFGAIQGRERQDTWHRSCARRWHWLADMEEIVPEWTADVCDDCVNCGPACVHEVHWLLCALHPTKNMHVQIYSTSLFQCRHKDDGVLSDPFLFAVFVCLSSYCQTPALGADLTLLATRSLLVTRLHPPIYAQRSPKTVFEGFTPSQTTNQIDSHYNVAREFPQPSSPAA